MQTQAALLRHNGATALMSSQAAARPAVAFAAAPPESPARLPPAPWAHSAGTAPYPPAPAPDTAESAPHRAAGLATAAALSLRRLFQAPAAARNPRKPRTARSPLSNRNSSPAEAGHSKIQASTRSPGRRQPAPPPVRPSRSSTAPRLEYPSGYRRPQSPAPARGEGHGFFQPALAPGARLPRLICVSFRHSGLERHRPLKAQRFASSSLPRNC